MLRKIKIKIKIGGRDARTTKLSYLEAYAVTEQVQQYVWLKWSTPHGSTWYSRITQYLTYEYAAIRLDPGQAQA